MPVQRYCTYQEMSANFISCFLEFMWYTIYDIQERYFCGNGANMPHIQSVVPRLTAGACNPPHSRIRACQGRKTITEVNLSPVTLRIARDKQMSCDDGE